jgi:hypothetical protein
MTVNLKVDIHSVYSRLSDKQQDEEFSRQWNELIPQPMYLCREDYDALITALENPPAPNEKLKALMRGESYVSPDCPPHVYDAEKGAGIGFCKICYTDDSDHPIHIK